MVLTFSVDEIILGLSKSRSGTTLGSNISIVISRGWTEVPFVCYFSIFDGERTDGIVP